jgi:hypothetical protein
MPDGYKARASLLKRAWPAEVKQTHSWLTKLNWIQTAKVQK